MTKSRTETDSFGPIQVRADRYWGAQAVVFRDNGSGNDQLTRDFGGNGSEKPFTEADQARHVHGACRHVRVVEEGGR